MRQRGGKGEKGEEEKGRRGRRGRGGKGEGEEEEIKHDGYIQISDGGHVTRYLGNSVTQ